MTDFALVAKGGLANGAFWSSRMYAIGSIAEATAATAIHTAWGDLWSQITTYMPASSTVTLTEAVTLNASWKFGTGTSTTETLAGTSTDKSLMTELAPLITWKGVTRAKGKSARSYLPAAAINAVDTTADTGHLLAAFVTALKTGATNFLNALTSAGLTVVMLDRKDFSNITITEGLIPDRFAFQDRRGDKSAVTYT